MSKDVPRAELLADLYRTVRDFQRAVDEMDEAASAHFGVNRSDARALDELQAEGPLPAGELAHRLHLSPGAVTTLIDRLEAAGYVRRRRSTVDRRRIDVEMTERAHEMAARLYEPIAAVADEELARFDDDALRLITDFLRTGTRVNREAGARARELPLPDAS